MRAALFQRVFSFSFHLSVISSPRCCSEQPQKIFILCVLDWWARGVIPVAAALKRSRRMFIVGKKKMCLRNFNLTFSSPSAYYHHQAVAMRNASNWWRGDFFSFSFISIVDDLSEIIIGQASFLTFLARCRLSFIIAIKNWSFTMRTIKFLMCGDPREWGRSISYANQILRCQIRPIKVMWSGKHRINASEVISRKIKNFRIWKLTQNQWRSTQDGQRLETQLGTRESTSTALSIGVNSSL